MREATALLLFPALMAFAAASDLITMTIPNRLAIALAVGFAVFAIVCGLSLDTVAWSIGLAALVLLVTFFMFARGWMGGGDAKLAAATTLWLGSEGFAEYMLVAALGGGALTLAILYVRGNPMPSLGARFPWFARLQDPDVGVPYGIALAAAALLVYPHTALWRLAFQG